jgi:ArsR family transcriptional regulator
MLRTVADPTRLRILALLGREDLSVAELQEILSMGQSRISSQLAQLKRAGLVSDRRSGKNIFYTLDHRPPEGEPWSSLFAAVGLASREIDDIPRDAVALELALAKREDRMRAYFDQLAGKFGRSYLPGRSWKALAETLLKLMPPLVIADLGAGEGTFW